MKRLGLLLVHLLISVWSVSQIGGVVIDAQSNNPIPYVNIWVENEEKGTTSDKNGYFSLKDSLKHKTLIISSIGYEKQKIVVNKPFMTILLKPVVYAIEEVVIKPQKRKTIVIGQFRRSDLSLFVGNGSLPGTPGLPQIFARYFPYQPEYENTFIESIRFMTYSKVDAIINLRFFLVNGYGEPGRDLLKDNMIVDVKKGYKNNKIDDFNGMQLQIPRDGLFVAFEFLIIKENEYYFKRVLNEATKENVSATGFMPFIGTIDSKTNLNSWIYFKGKWGKDLGKRYHEMNQPDKNHVLAIEIKLSD